MDEQVPIQLDSAGLAARAKAIVMAPKAEWPVIAQERSTPRQVLLGYAVPLAAIGPIAAFIGRQLFGFGFLGIRIHVGLLSGLSTAIVTYVMALASLFIVALAANFLSPKFGGRSDWPAAFRLVAYSMTASWLAGIFGLIPSLSILAILGLYSFYLFYLGATPVLGVPQDKATGFTVVTVILVIVLYFIAAALVTATTGGMDLGTTGAVALADRNASIDLGSLGKVSVNGDTTTITANGHTTTVRSDGNNATLTSDGDATVVSVPK